MLGLLFGSPGGLWGPSWGAFGRSQSALGSLWAALGRSCGALGAVLGRSWAALACILVLLGRLLALLGALGEPLVAFSVAFGPVFALISCGNRVLLAMLWRSPSVARRAVRSTWNPPAVLMTATGVLDNQPRDFRRKIPSRPKVYALVPRKKLTALREPGKRASEN